MASNSAPSPLVKDGDISSWWIDDDESNLDRVVTALASSCDNLADASFVRVPQQVVESLQVDIRHTPGETPDSEANSLWHRDLTGLSDDCHDPTLIALGNAINAAEQYAGKRTVPQLRRLITEGLEAGHLDITKITPSVLQKIGVSP